MAVFFHTKLLMKIVIDLSGICFPISFTHGKQLKATLLLSEKYRYEEREKIPSNICFATLSKNFSFHVTQVLILMYFYRYAATLSEFQIVLSLVLIKLNACVLIYSFQKKKGTSWNVNTWITLEFLGIVK